MPSAPGTVSGGTYRDDGRMIDPRLQAVLDDAVRPTRGEDETAPVSRPELSAVFSDTALAEITDAIGVTPRIGPDGTLTVSPALRRVMDAVVPRHYLADVPGPEQAPEGPYRNIGEGLTAQAITPPVTGTSPWFTTGHWHWLSAKGYVRPMPAELGIHFPHLFLSEAQIVHDLKEWAALDRHGALTAEADAMFGAVTGSATLTLYGTVLLYAHRRREPVTLPAELQEFGVAAAVRDVPRVTFAVGLTDDEVVTALVNNDTVVFNRRWRRSGLDDDAAVALRELLDPVHDWAPYPLDAPVTLAGEVVEELATGETTAGIIDSEPGDEASEEERAADRERREKVGGGVRSVLRGAHLPKPATEAIAAIATATTDAMAQVTVKTAEVDVPRGEPAALALAFLRGRGVVASYPSWSGTRLFITYVTGNEPGIATGISALRRVASGG